MAVHLQKEIEKLKKMILRLGGRVETSFRDAVYSVQHCDWDLARRVIEQDLEIDYLEVDVEEEALKILALHQPVANDLRFIVAVLKINDELERIGDLSSNIAERAISLTKYGEWAYQVDFSEMAEITKTMLRQGLDALVNLDAELARDTCLKDDIVDNLNRQMINRLQEQIKATPERVEPLIHLLSTSRAIERVGDCTTNIAEDIIYMIKGQIVRHRAARQQELGNRMGF